LTVKHPELDVVRQRRGHAGSLDLSANTNDMNNASMRPKDAEYEQNRDMMHRTIQERLRTRPEGDYGALRLEPLQQVPASFNHAATSMDWSRRPGALTALSVNPEI